MGLRCKKIPPTITTASQKKYQSRLRVANAESEKNNLRGRKYFMNVLPPYFPGMKCFWFCSSFTAVVVAYLCSSLLLTFQHNRSLRHDSGIFSSPALPSTVFTYDSSKRGLSPCALNTLPQWLVSKAKSIFIYNFRVKIWIAAFFHVHSPVRAT